jgi:hypothetical protein
MTAHLLPNARSLLNGTRVQVIERLECESEDLCVALDAAEAPERSGQRKKPRRAAATRGDPRQH